ncbi:carbon-nitrogen hydrolase family protein [Actinacidiphila alni]|uniref:carbon-nitrogen hydrolase family protein n=1 Tax=Actinacidiphila alni TaxID=380248 RepID=UPI0033D0852A
MRIALAQMGGVPASAAAGLDALERAAADASRQDARLLITPELSLTGYAVGDRTAALAEPADGPAAHRVAGIAARYGIAVVHGYPERAGDAVHNSVRLTGPDGAALADYRKTHLFGGFERAAFTPGDIPVVQADLDGLRIGLLICYDVEFPEAVRAHALAGTHLLAVPTALMRPYEFVAQTLVPARAYESQLHLAYVNRHGAEGEYHFAGLSCLAGPDGAVRARAGTGEELLFADVASALIAAARAETPYLSDRRPELYRSLV